MEADVLSQKLTRSTKTLVKAAVKPGRKSCPLIIDDSSESDEGVPLPTSMLPVSEPKIPAEPMIDTSEPPIGASVPAIDASEPSLKKAKTGESPNKKFNYREYVQRRAAGPSAPGSKELPTGAAECLVGLTFVFTGELSSISRDSAQDLVKRYGGRVTSAPSGKTDYVVVGEGAGASKLGKIQSLGLKTLDEDSLFELIRSSRDREAIEPPSVGAPKFHSHPKITTRTGAQETTLASVPITKQQSVAARRSKTTESQLWTDKYAPQTEADLIGNHSNYVKLVEWMQDWQPTKSSERAVLVSGPPGIGKTTSVHMAAKQASFETVEMNASDSRSKSSLQDHVRDVIDNKSLSGFFSPKIPIVCICNDRSSPKVRSLANHCLDLRFRRPDARMIAPRILAIAGKEGLQLGMNTVEELANSTQGDIRQILNLLSTFRLTATDMNFDQSKALGGGSRKDLEHGPFDAVPALLGSGYDRMSLAEKIDQYFVDSSLVPLMVHENYIRCRPNTARTLSGQVDLCFAAAMSISEADAIDALIHGANQEWSLAPLHAVMSSVRPAYFCHGSMTGRVEFAAWLGQNSKRNKNLRLVGELTKHTFLHTATCRKEFQQSYVPLLAHQLLQPLLERGSEGIPETIAVMDTYTLTREDFDAILELNLDPNYTTATYAKIPTAVKTAFTRTYNQTAHKLPYSVGGGIPVKRISSSELPPELVEDAEDAEEADDNDNDNDHSNDNGSTNDDGDITKDKMIKTKTTIRKASSTGPLARGRGRGRGRGK